MAILASRILNTLLCQRFGDTFYTKFQVCSANRSQWARRCSTDEENKKPPLKISLGGTYTKLYQDYWHVVHSVGAVTSLMWLSGLYYCLSCGTSDVIVRSLESWDLNQDLLEDLRTSKFRDLALAIACYQVAAPFRYATTLGVSRMTVTCLNKMGLIKPKPFLNSKQMKNFYDSSKEVVKKWRRNKNQ